MHYYAHKFFGPPKSNPTIYFLGFVPVYPYYSPLYCFHKTRLLLFFLPLFSQFQIILYLILPPILINLLFPTLLFSFCLFRQFFSTLSLFCVFSKSYFYSSSSVSSFHSLSYSSFFSFSSSPSYR